MDADKYRFLVQWVDPLAKVVRTFMLIYSRKHVGMNSISLVDVKVKKQFLRETDTSFSLEDFYLGASVTVASRQLKVVGFADRKTEETIGRARTVGLICTPAYESLGRVISAANENGLKISKLKMLQLSGDAAAEVAAAMDVDVADLKGDVVAIELAGGNSCERWVSVASKFHGVVGSRSPEMVPQHVELLFGAHAPRPSAALDNASLLIVKPHAVREGKLGPIIETLQTCKFEISGILQAQLSTDEATEFLGAYEGVIPNFGSAIRALYEGPCVAVEVRCMDAVSSLRRIVGPYDVEIAKLLRPGTLRAKFGNSTTENAVHCTDLEEDAALELEFFFG